MMLNENTFVEVCWMEPITIWEKVRSGSFQNAMRFLREWQESLASYSERHVYDEIQKRALATQQFMERRIMRPFIVSKQKSYRRNHPLWPESMVKQKAKEDWGRFYKRIAY